MLLTIVVNLTVPQEATEIFTWKLWENGPHWQQVLIQLFLQKSEFRRHSEKPLSYMKIILPNK